MTASSIENVQPLTIGIVASSAGSSLQAAYEIFSEINPGRLKLIIATDRQCGVEHYCKNANITYQRFCENNNEKLSKAVSDYFFSVGGIDAVLLFFLRLVTSELFCAFPTLNIHPSLLPEYKGFNAIERALADGSKKLGASIHMVDDRIDGGYIVAQTQNSLANISKKSEVFSLSFCQKTYLTLWFFESMVGRRLRFELDDAGEYKPLFLGRALEQKNIEAAYLSSKLEEAYLIYMSGLGYSRLL